MSAPNQDGSGAPALDRADLARLSAELQECRQRCDKLAERERRIAGLLNSATPDRIEHDLRNVMNELQLLRTLFERQGESC